jgi:hypothetical protein
MQEERMRNMILVVAGLIVLCSSLVGFAETAHTGLTVQLVQARQANAALMRQYTWESRTELTVNGVVKDLLLDQNIYGFDGNSSTLQRILLNDQSALLPSGFLRKKIAENEREKTEKYIKGLRALLDQYTLPSNGKLTDFITKATVAPLDASAVMKITGSNVVTPGDSVTLSVNGLNNQAAGMKITTLFSGDQVTVTSSFRTISPGLTYMAYAQMDVAGKGITLLLQNFNYTKQNK